MGAVVPVRPFAVALLLLVSVLVPAASPSPARAALESRPLETRTEDYSLGTVRLPELRAPAPVVGHVVAPVGASGARPLVLILHGKHTTCFDPRTGDLSARWPCTGGARPVASHRGYHYLQRTLAARGFVTVSIAANAVDGQEDVDSLDSGVSARSALVRHHLRLWSRWAQGRGAYGVRWHGRVDLSRVTLVGHSRGGEGVDRAAIDTREGSPWRIAGQVLLAPSAVLRQEAPLVPTVVVLPYCDGDLNEWPGQTYVDIARDVVVDPALRASVVVMGANHNFFNTEWTPGLATTPAADDAATFYGDGHPICGRTASRRLDAAGQRKATRVLVGAAARLFTDGDRSALRLFDGGRRSIAGSRIHASGLGGRRVLVRPGLDARVAGSADADVSLCTARSDAGDPTLCGRGIFWIRTPHWPSALESPPLPAAPAPPAAEMSWDSRGARLSLVLDTSVNLARSSHLEARVVVDPGRGPVRLAFRVVDDHGRAALLTPRARGHLNPLPGTGRLLGRLWGQTLRAPLGQLATTSAGAGTVDLGAVRRISLVARSPGGRIWLLDAAGWRRGLAPLPERRVPRLNVLDVTVDEGPAGLRTVDVPVVVDGELTTRARIAVQVLDLDGEPPPISVLTLRPGQRRAVIPVQYRADAEADGDLERIVNTWALSGAVTGDRQGHVVIRDDDR